MKTTQLAATPLTANLVPSFYPGNGQIATFRREPALPRSDPEDWIASATPRTGMAPMGLSTLPDGTLLTDAFVANPTGWFGEAHLRRHGARPGLLLKLLDAGRRLPLHIHPTRPFAVEHLASDYGKTEAWVVLHARPGAGIHLGFSTDLTEVELRRLVLEQDVAGLLGQTNYVPVAAGDVLLCPAGVPHAIGEGIMVLELQEMTDLSIMLEWAGYPIDTGDVFLGLDEAVALAAAHRAALRGEELDRLRGQCVRPLGTAQPGTTSLLPTAADDYFVADQVVPGTGGEPLDQRFAVLVISEGTGTVHSAEGEIPVAAGQTVLIPHAARDVRLSGDLTAIRCYPA